MVRGSFRLMRRVWAATIWSRGAIPPQERKYASPLKRVIFPVYDAAVALVGYFGLNAGVKAISLAVPDPWPTFLFWGLIVAGVVCFFGCAFPKLWVAEILGKGAILVSLLSLLFAMLVTAWRVEGYTGLAFAPVIVMMIMFPLLRLWILGIEITERRRTRAGGAVWNG